MKSVSFALNGATTGPADLQTDLSAASAAGYAAIELRDTKIDTYLQNGGSIAGVGALCRESRLTVASLNALEDSTLATGRARETVMARCGQLCSWARALDCAHVIAVPSVLAGDAHVDVTSATVDALGRMAEVARAGGVKIGFEFLGFPACSVRTVEQARRILDDVGDPSVGLVIDAFHFFVGGSTWEMLDGLSPDRLFMVHLDDAEHGASDALTDQDRVLPGDGSFPLKEFVSRIHALGYAGSYSLELFRPEYWAWDPMRLAKIGLEKMEALFQ